MTFSGTKSDPENDCLDEKKPLVGLRWILVYIIFFTYVVLYFVRNSISVTLVAMVNSTVTEDQQDAKDQCPASSNTSTSDSEETVGEFDWTSGQQGLIFESYFWGQLISRLFLSRIGEIIGQRQTISIGIASAGILALISPVCASFSPYALAATRLLTGICYGPVTSAAMSLFAVWAPKSELGSMTTTAFSGLTVGSLLGLFAAGWLSQNFSWRLVFYVGGVLNLLIPPVWIFFVTNSPFEHRLLSSYERKLLLENINIKTKKSVPWVKIITSPYVAIIVYALFARTWLDIIMNTEGPSFFKFKIGLELDTASYVNGFSTFMSFVAVLMFGKLSDFIMNKQYLSKTNTRKLFHFITTAGTSVLLLGIIIAGCNSTVVIVLWIMMGGVAAACAVTYPLSVIDIAPNFTATVNGFMAIGTLAGAVAPSVTSALLNKNNGWNKSFYLIIGLSMLSCVLFVLFMTSKPQSWNYEREDKDSRRNSDAYDTRF